MIVLDNIFPPSLLRAVAANWPADDWAYWHRYCDENTDKYGSRDAARLPDAAKLVINELAKLNVSVLGDCDDAFPDLDLHGAGLHAIVSGGHLGLHLDGEVHPLKGWVRRANAILFVDDWEPHWGGRFELCDGTGKLLSFAEPKRGRLMLFSTSAQAWHRVSKVTGPIKRRTVSLFWWAEGFVESRRMRAEFSQQCGE